LGGQIAIVRESTSHEKTGGAGVSVPKSRLDASSWVALATSNRPDRLEVMQRLAIFAAAVGVAAGCASGGQNGPRCVAEVWEGECQLTSVTKVADAEFPIPHVVMEAVYKPVANPRFPGYTPGAVAERTMTKAKYELSLYDYLEGHPRVACRTEAPRGGACAPPTVYLALAPFDAEAAAAAAAEPPITGCAQIEATSTQDKLQGGQTTQTFIAQRLTFAGGSSELPADADAVLDAVKQLLDAKPGIECLGVIGQVTSGEPPALAEQRAQAVRELLRRRGVAESRLLTVGVTAKVFGTGSRPEASDPTERRVSFAVLLEHAPKP
jgi:outer membrane protein OmpA-like peptidoglycan-associated protein